QLRAELAVRKANLEAAKASLRRLEMMPRPEEVPPLEAKAREMKSAVDDARDQAQRAVVLFRSKATQEEDAIHKRNALAVAEAQLAKAEADLLLMRRGAWDVDKEVARASVAQAAASVQQTEIELERLIVRAPVDGKVLQRN